MRAALVAIGRLENEYAREFVEHHLGTGFDTVVIYDNNHRGEEHFEDVLQDYVDAGKVVIEPWRDIEQAQRGAYNHAYSKYSKGYDWLAFFDFDEFLCLPNGTLKELLATVPTCYDCMMVPWLIMTDNGLIRNDHRPLMERFTESVAHPQTLGKCIIRTVIDGLRFTKSVHVPYHPTLACCTPTLEETVQRKEQPQDTSVAYLKHFSTKTIEEWLTNKWRKGAAGVSYEKFQRHYRDYFFKFNERTAEKEAFIKNYKQ